MIIYGLAYSKKCAVLTVIEGIWRRHKILHYQIGEFNLYSSKL